MTEKRFTCELIDTDLYHIETITDNFEMDTFDDVETVTELLNKFSEENNELKQSIRVIYDLIDGYIAIADKYRKPIKSLRIGDDLGYWNGVYQYMKKLKERIGVL